jgi:phosphotriesterase-related protein
MATGYFLASSHPPELATKTEEEITQEMVRDITVGVGDTGVRAGIIKLGLGMPWEDSERKVMRACAAAQQRTGVAINIHPSWSDELVLETIKILGDAGADLSRIVISHLDGICYPFSPATIRKIADAGCYIEFDTFGHPVLPFLPSSTTPGRVITTEGRLIGRRSEVDRINAIKCLIDDGYLNHILISHDIGYKHCYATCGGAGYAHILRNLVPWMRLAGISDEQIHTMMVENPKRVLSFAPVKE